MAMALRALITKHPSLLLLSSASRAFATRPLPSSSSLLRLRPLIALADRAVARGTSGGLRCFSTSRTASSLNDPSPNWSNRPPKETILLDGCDFEHWLVVVDPPEPSLTRDEIIQSYIKTLAKVVGSEEESRFKIYSVSTKHYFAFGALVSEELSYKLKEIPGVRWVLPDSYLDVKNKDYGGEPFINGEAVPYDPKYHEEWVRNNARANERNRRNDRPRNSDRSRNFERRRENMQNFQNRAPPPPPPMHNQDQGTHAGQNPNPPRDMPNAMPRDAPNRDFRGYQNQMPNYQSGSLSQSGNVPHRDGGMPTGGSFPPGNNAYQGSPNAFQGGSAGYQGPPITNQGGPGGYQGNPNAYQGNQNAYQGGAGGYQGTPNAPRGGPVGYQGAPQGGYQGMLNAPQGGPGGYQGPPNASQGGPVGYQGSPNAPQGGPGGFQGTPNAPPGGPGGYQGSPNSPQGGPGGYQGPPNAYQGGSYQGGGGPHAGNAYEGGDGGGAYQGRDMPGRDQ